MLDFGLRGRVVVVTGGASGIGLACARRLVQDGARVAITDRDGPAVEAVLAELRQAGGTVTGHVLDVRDAAATGQAFAAVEAELGKLAGLVASAGTSGAAPAETLPEEEWRQVIDVNLTGLFLSCSAAGRLMIANGQGAIVTIGSIDALGGHPGRAHYVASKYGVVGYTKTAALEWGRHGIRVNCVAPGLVDTPLLRRGVPAHFASAVAEDRAPFGRMAQPDDIAGAVLALLSDATGFVTGAVLPVDGGLTAGYLTRAQGADLSSTRLLAAGVYTE